MAVLAVPGLSWWQGQEPGRVCGTSRTGDKDLQWDTRAQPHESSVERKAVALFLGRICFSLKSASYRQHRRKIHVVFSLPPSSYQSQEVSSGRSPRISLGQPQGCLSDIPGDASRQPLAHPSCRTRGSSAGAASAAQGVDAGSLGRLLRSQPRQNQRSRAACWVLLELPGPAGLSPHSHSYF